MLALLVALTPTVGGATTPQQSSAIPEDFVRALLTRVNIVPELFPGEITPVLAELAAVPDDARVLGTIAYDDSHTVYLEIDDGAGAYVASTRDRLTAAGWQAAELPRRTGFVQTGVPAPPSSFCRQRSVVSLPAVDDSLVTVSLNPDVEPDESVCFRMAQTPDAGNEYEELREHMPVLTVPEGEVGRRGSRGGMGGRSSMTSVIEIETSMSPAQIVDHVGGELDAQGWSPEAAAAGSLVHIAMSTKTFDDGFEALGQLTVLALEPGRYEVTFLMRKLNED